MNSLNLSLAVTGAFAEVISPHYESRHVDGKNEEDQFHGKFHIIPKDRPIVLLVMCVSCAFGALLRTILKETKIPILVIIFMVGLILGIIAHFSQKLPFVKIIADIDPILFLHLFTPIIIFTAAFEMDLYIFRKSFWQNSPICCFADMLDPLPQFPGRKVFNYAN